MREDRTALNIAVACILGLGLVVGLFLLLSMQLSFVRAASGRDDVEAARSEQTSGAVITVCLGGGCDFDSVQAAVDAAIAGDEIRVAGGTYTDVSSRAGLTQVVYISKSVTIRGGYAVDNWITPDSEANPTTLDAQGRGRVLYLSGDGAPKVEGLRITGGRANGLGGGLPPGAPDAGGGIFVRDADGILRGNHIFSNTASLGAGICVKDSDIGLVDNTVASNVAPGNFSGGGGVTLWHTGVTMTDNQITHNEAAYGGGLYLLSNFNRALVARNLIAGNTAAWGGGAYLNNDQSTIRENELRENTVEAGGGGIAVQNSGSRLEANRILDNEASNGGGIMLYDTESTLVNMVIADNRADSCGGGVYVWEAGPSLLHTTLARNSSSGETCPGTGVVLVSGSADMVNTILVANTSGVYAAAGTTVTLQSTLWGVDEWSNGMDWAGPGTIITGTASDNVWGDPAFVAPERGDYHIGVASAGIDEGTYAAVNKDADGYPRPIPVGGRVDVGAYESTGIDLSSSSKTASAERAEVGDVITYSIALRNTGHLSAENLSLVDEIPDNTSYVSGTAQAASGVLTEKGSIEWSGTVGSQEAVTLTFAVTLDEDGFIGNTAIFTDAYGVTTRLRSWINAFRHYLPFLLRDVP